MVRLKQIYDNRININVLRRNLENASQNNKIIVKKQIYVLGIEKENLSSSKPTSVFEQYKKQRKVSKIECKINYFQCIFDRQWQSRSAQLLKNPSKNLATLIQAGKLLRAKTEIIFTNTDHCTICNHKYVFDCQRYVNICIHCKVVKIVLIADEDTMNDILVLREHVVNSVPTTQSSTSVRNGRLTLYKKFMYQFAEDVPEVPEEVFAVIYNNLSSVHMLTSFRCKSVPVTDILRNNNYKEWISQSMRITMLFNGEKVPCINTQLLQKCLTRFEHVSLITLNDVKLLSFEILTHVFLTLENEKVIAGLFLLPRSKNVLINMIARIKIMCEACKKVYIENWDYSHALL